MLFAYSVVVLLIASFSDLGVTSIAHAQQGEDLREAAQNPLADLIGDRPTALSLGSTEGEIDADPHSLSSGHHQ
jgi:hypothetical protein